MSRDMRPEELDELLAETAWVKSLARSLLFDQELVDDVVQQTWLVALQRQPREPGRRRAWLAGILRNVLRHQVRSENRRQRHERAAGAARPAVSSAELVAQTELHRHLVDAVLSLEEPFRSAIILRYFHGLALHEIGKQLDVPAGTIRSRVHRGLEQLRGRLDSSGDDDRRNWSIALIPLAVPTQPGVVTASLPTLFGVLTMAAKLKVGVAAVLVLLALGGWWAVGNATGDAPSPPITQPSPVLPTTEPMDVEHVVADPTPANTPAPIDVAPDPGARGGPAANGGMPRMKLTGRVIDERGAPIRGARVFLHPSHDTLVALHLPTSQFRQDFPWDQLPDTTETDELGRFSFSGAEVLVGAPPSPTHDTGPEFFDGSSVVVYLEEFQPAALSVTPAAELALGDITLVRGSVLTGRVVDGDGDPLAGARVGIPYFGRIEGGHGGDPWNLTRALMTARSGTDGRFRLGTLSPGEFQINISRAGHAMWSQAQSFSAGSTAELGDVVLTAGGMIRGRVLSDDGEPLPGARIKLHSRKFASSWRGEDTVHSLLKVIYQSADGSDVETLSGPDGQFLFDDLRPAPHLMVAWATGREPQLLDDVAPDGEQVVFHLRPEALVVLTLVDASTGEPLEGGTAKMLRLSEPPSRSAHSMPSALDVLVGPAAARRLGRRDGAPGLVVGGPAGFVGTRVTASAPGYATVEVELPGVEVGGRLEHTVRLPVASSLAGRVVDTSGAPLADVSLRLERYSSRGSLQRQAPVRSDDEGAFRFEDLSAGSWKVTAELAGYFTPQQRTVQVEPQQQLVGVDVVLDRGAELHGILRAADGQPAPWETIYVDRIAPERGTASVQTDVGGHFHIEGLAPGRVKVSAEPGAEEEVDLNLDSAADVELWLRVPPTVRGRVVDPGGAASAATVQLFHERWGSFSGEAATDALGEYVLEPPFPGRYLVVARDGLVTTPAVAVDLPWGSEEIADLRFGGGGVRGLVRDADSGDPLPGVRLEAMTLDFTLPFESALGPPELEATTDEAGRFEITRMQAARYQLVSRDRDYILADKTPLEIAIADTVVERTLRVVRGGVLTGIARTTGEPDEKNLWMHLEPLDDLGEAHGGGVPFDGEYRITGLRTGSYRYEVKRLSQLPPLPDQEHVFARGEVSVEQGETVRRDLVLVPADG